jgi:ABC-type multidrug transport system fused ATPase/permease subunit
MVGGSTIAIARRLVSIRGTDMIVVLEDGEVVEIGTYDELLRVDGAYADLIRLQRYGNTSTKVLMFRMS